MVLKEYRGTLTPNAGNAYIYLDFRDRKYVRIVECEFNRPIAATIADNDVFLFQLIKGVVTTSTDLVDNALLLTMGFHIHMAAEGLIAPNQWSKRGSVKGAVTEGITVLAYAQAAETFHYRILLDINEAR